MLRPPAVRALLVALAFLCALGLRSGLNHENVFRGGEVVFQDPDSAFHARTIQNLLRHFPYRGGFDPYSGFPTGQNIDTGPFHDYAIGTVAWMAGFGAPSRYLTDVAAAWFPAVLGALLVIPVYFLGRNLFEPAVGVIAAGLIAILPGTYLWVSRLGNPDHHVTEVVLSTLLLLVLVKALEANAPRRLILLAGLLLGCYLATRAAGAFLVLFVEIWAIVQICSNHWRGKSSRLVWTVTVPPLFTGWLILFLAGPTVWSGIANLVLWSGILGISGVAALSEWLRSPMRFFLALLGALAAGAGAAAFLKPRLLQYAIATVTDRAAGPAQTVGELRPLLESTGSFSFMPAWEQFTTCWFLAPVALIYLGWRALRENSHAHLLFAVWSALMMAASFHQIRNSSYLAVNMALLSGFAVSRLIRFERRGEQIAAGVLVGAALLIPNLSAAYPLASRDTGPGKDWWGALMFLRHETPEPFGDPAVFDRYFPRLAPGGVFRYPETAYGILSWWDFGHWITAYARRIPVANGMQTGAVDAARFFTSTDPAGAAEILRRTGTRYVIADSSLPLGGPQVQNFTGGIFQSMTIWAGEKSEKYWEQYWTGSPGSDQSFLVFYPAYYQSMLARLYVFDGEAQSPGGSTWVIRYSEDTARGGRRKLNWSKQFGTYEEAQQYIQEHPAPNLVIAGLNPSRSCVPVPKLNQYRLEYTSPVTSSDPLQAIKIFKYQP